MFSGWFFCSLEVTESQSCRKILSGDKLWCWQGYTYLCSPRPPSRQPGRWAGGQAGWQEAGRLSPGAPSLTEPTLTSWSRPTPHCESVPPHQRGGRCSPWNRQPHTKSLTPTVADLSWWDLGENSLSRLWLVGSSKCLQVSIRMYPTLASVLPLSQCQVCSPVLSTVSWWFSSIRVPSDWHNLEKKYCSDTAQLLC